MNKNKVKSTLTVLGLGVLFGGVVAEGSVFAIDIINGKKGKNLPLLSGGIHLREGNHNVVITDQFYSHLKYENQVDKDIVVNGFKEAYNDLNRYNAGLNFTLCTTNKELATEYNIPNVSEIGSQDIPLYCTTEIIENNKNVMASTGYNEAFLTHEMKDVSITFKKDSLFKVWRTYDTVEETLNVYNTAAYTTCAHESMHAIGFSHIDDHESIMNTYVSYSGSKTFTDYDIKLMDEFNTIFYGTKSQLNQNNAIDTPKSAKVEDMEM